MNKKRVLFFLILVMFIINLLYSPVYADAYCIICGEAKGKDHSISAHCMVCNGKHDEDKFHCTLCQETHDVSDLSFAQITAINWNDVVYGGNWFGNKTAGASDELNTTAVLRFDISSGVFATLWNQAEVFYNALMPAGIILAMVYIFIELGDKVASDTATPEQVVKSILKIALAIFFIKNGFIFCSFIVKAATVVFDEFSKFAGPGAGDCLYYSFVREDAIAGIAAMSDRFIPWLIMLLVTFIISIMCWARVIDIMVKILLAPVGMADIPVTGTKGSGWSFFKKLGGSALQGTIVIAIAKAYGLTASILKEMAPMTGVPTYSLIILAGVVTVFAILKSQAYTADILS